MAEIDADIEWLSDYILHFLESPTWVAPVAQFVDERCIIFDLGQQEEKLEYTECHMAYQQLVDRLFAERLQELSVADSDFERFCLTGLTTNSQLHRVLVEQILSVEDYLMFKGMMVQRNADLYRETLRSMAEDQVQYVVEDACDEIDTVDTTVFDLLEEDGREAGQVVAQEWRQCEDQILSGLVSSGEEELEAQRRCEEAELERAIALSLQAEEERVRRLAEGETASEEVAPSPDAGTTVEPVQAPAAESSPGSGSGMAPAPAPAAVGAKRELAPLKKVLPRMLRVESLSQARPPSRNAASQDIEHLRVDVVMQRERAGRVAASPQPPPPPATIVDPPAPVSAPGQRPTEAERRLRAERLHHHRQLLLERRRQDRERHFATAQAQPQGRNVGGLDRAASAARLTPEPDEASRRLASELGAPASAIPPASAPPATAQQLRHALTTQLRQTLPGALANSGVGPVGDQINRLEQLRLR